MKCVKLHWYHKQLHHFSVKENQQKKDKTDATKWLQASLLKTAGGCSCVTEVAVLDKENKEFIITGFYAF